MRESDLNLGKMALIIFMNRLVHHESTRLFSVVDKMDPGNITTLCQILTSFFSFSKIKNEAIYETLLTESSK